MTEHLKVIYYVSESFADEYTGTNLKNVEKSVEEDYIANLRNNCWKEKQQSEYCGVRSGGSWLLHEVSFGRVINWGLSYAKVIL